MNNHFRCTAIIFILMLLIAPAFGEETLPSFPTTLSEAFDMAIKERPELRLELEREIIARSKIKEIRGNFLPTLDFVVSHYYLDNFDEFTGINISSQIAGQNVLVDIHKEAPQYQLNSELNLVYNLYAGGRDKAFLKKALSDLESSQCREAVTLRKIRIDVANAYWGLRKNRIEYAIAKRMLAVVRLELKVAETQHRIDRISDVAYEAVQLKSREKEVLLKIADRNCLRAFRTYLQVIGLPADHQVPSSENVPELKDDPDQTENAGEQNSIHPEIRRLNSELQSAAERVTIATSMNYPTVDLFAKYSLVGRDIDSYFDSWKDVHSEYYMIGLKVTTNLFNGLRTKERVRQADAEVRVRRLRLIQKNRELAEAEQVRKTALETALDQLELAMERKELMETQEKSARSRVESGRISELAYRKKAAEAETAADTVQLARIDVVLAKNALDFMVLEE